MRLIDIVKSFPDKNWSFKYLSKNPNISFQDIIDNPQFNWDWDEISKNPTVTLSDIINNSDKNWDCESLSGNINIPIKFFIENKDKEWNWVCISLHPELTIDILLKNQDIHWHWPNVSRNSGITLKNILDNQGIPWDWRNVASNPNLTPKYLKIFNKRFDLYYCHWSYLSKNLNLSIKFILETPWYNWDYNEVALRPDLTLEIIKKYPHVEWNYYYLSRNPNITMDYVFQNLEKQWRWYNLFSYAKIKPEDLTNNKYQAHSPFNIETYSIVIANNPNISIRNITDIMDNKVLNLRYKIIENGLLSCNKHININELYKSIKEGRDYLWDYMILSINHFGWAYNYSQNFNQERMDATIEKIKLFKYELINVAMHPDRFFYWYLGNDDKKEIEKRWKN